jgi:very-short-patch-repair endonuclease
MAGAGRVDIDYRGQLGPPVADRAVAALAGAQHGVVARVQLRDLGLTGAAIDRRVATGRLHVVHRGVYAVGHPVLGRHGRWLAAVLACGPGAALSHASAAALWELRASAATRTDVTVRRSGRAQRAGLRIHRPRTLSAEEITTHEGIPVTTPARTILDLAATLQRRRLERLLDQAETTRVTDVPSLIAMARAHPGHRGAGRLLATLGTHRTGTTMTRSELEERLLRLCREHDLPLPMINERVAGLEVDVLFADARLVVEADSWQYHRTRHAFERDRERDAILARAGHRTLRFTDRQLEHQAAAVAQTIRAALAMAPFQTFPTGDVLFR